LSIPDWPIQISGGQAECKVEMTSFAAEESFEGVKLVSSTSTRFFPISRLEIVFSNAVCIKGSEKSSPRGEDDEKLFFGRGQHMGPWSIDPLRGPGPWTGSMNPVHGPPIFPINTVGKP